ncbi:MAG: tetratricopeptide repeat protein [Pseudomonadota bacterium]
MAKSRRLAPFTESPTALAQPPENSIFEIASLDQKAYCHLRHDEVDQAVALWQNAARGGDAHAKFRLGQLYYRGKHVPGDLNTALEWLYAADEDGNPRAPYYIGRICEFNGDRDFAVEWFQLGAKRGDHATLARMGFSHLHGWGVSKSRDQAYAYFLAARDAGSFTAQAQIIRLLASGYQGLSGRFRSVPCFFRGFADVTKFAVSREFFDDDVLKEKFLF